MDDVEAASALDPSFFSLKVSRVPARSERRELVGWAPARGIHILSLERSKKIYTRSVAPEYFTTFVGYGVGLVDCNWLNGDHYVLVLLGNCSRLAGLYSARTLVSPQRSPCRVCAQHG